MFPAVQLALLALGAASCPSNLANDLATPAPAASRQLITVEDSSSRVYNTFQRIGCGRKPPFKVTTPDLSTSPRAYAHLAVIDYNTHPVVPGRGSGIFLHVQIGKATSGCVSLPRPALGRVLRWLRRDALPQIAIGTTDSLRQARRS